MTTFQDDQVRRLLASGWSTCGGIAGHVRAGGLPSITREYLNDAVGSDQWQFAEEAVRALTDRFSSARFADEVRYGVVLVPAASALDTRGAMPAAVRADQAGAESGDVYDERLPAGTLLTTAEHDWTMVAGVVGNYGPALGSYYQVTDAPAEDFTLFDQDTRRLMTRQVWGARVLQCGRTPPDCELNERWTFTLFPGEPLVDGLAESGTVLKGRVRFRLGKPDRGIGSARVAPAIAISP
ncbi:hypothetical protein EV138_5089 [Kribbella voronezhensis]|uniref:Uncharacterized protein n=1 Tax=Kribbella voronezhensis TaxID=2512212 RepID=A0A4V3FKU0_9ACTN|nr:hypothetical protein [Kribbella voronezhensis]TDU91483.1 hypothetical protein EV138_5089 [Kribbella voronezhensis]